MIKKGDKAEENCWYFDTAIVTSCCGGTALTDSCLAFCTMFRAGGQGKSLLAAVLLTTVSFSMFNLAVNEIYKKFTIHTNLLTVIMLA